MKEILPTDFTIASTYFNNDWSRKSAVSAFQGPVGTSPIKGDEGTLIAKILVQESNTTDGFLVGFGGAADSKRMLVGYEPAAAYRGFVFFNGGTGLFTRILPDAAAGEYFVRVSKRGMSFVAQVAADDEFENILGQVSATARNLPNQSPRISAKMPTPLSMVGYVKYSDKALAHPNTPARISANGKQVIVTRFRGDGNNWCFIRTPHNYTRGCVIY